MYWGAGGITNTYACANTGADRVADTDADDNSDRIASAGSDDYATADYGRTNV
jgi:hypothetical protein